MNRERGDTLIEVLVAVMIVGIGAAAVLTALGEGITLSGTHRQLSRTDTDARNFAEALTKAVDTKAVAYTPCASTTTYGTSQVGYSPSAGDTVVVNSVAFWNGTGFATSGCTTSTDKGVQRVTVSVTNIDGSASRAVQVIIRKPCLLVDVTAGPCS